MKKHIEKRCVTHIQTDEKIFEVFEGNFDASIPLMPKNVPKNYSAFMVTEDAKVLIAFQFNDNGRVVLIPEPDPILIYFDTAYHNLREIKNRRTTLLDHFKGEKMDEDYLVALYAFYGCVNTFIIMLFTALEAFMNNIIPDNYIHHIASARKTESYDKGQIMLLDFSKKLKILNDVSKKDFSKSFAIKYQHITNLKEFRDNIVHLKPEKGTNIPYAYLYKKGLVFKFEETIDAIMDFINFYKPGFINYCPCVNDF